MEKLIQKYAGKLVSHGLCHRGEPLIGGLDAEATWSREGKEIEVLEKVLNGLNINSILFARPAEPYFSILNYLAEKSGPGASAIYPEDCETRTFLHDIPLSPEFTAESIVKLLKKRKSVCIPGRGIVTFGMVSPEQAFITYSSVCFALYAKFFVDCRHSARNKVLGREEKSILAGAVETYSRFLDSIPTAEMRRGPFKSRGEAISAMAEAGRMTVESRMVDSFFGNISCKFKDQVLISQTASSLDELEGYIDACPLDGSSSNAVTASVEYPAHKGIYALRDVSAVLHGHPKFCVIMSMICDDFECRDRGQCHIKCSKERYIRDVPIVPGEVGTGPTGLCRTLPPALAGRGAIVYGHGLFTAGREDFGEAYRHLVEIERMCFDEYRIAVINRRGR